MQERKQLIPDIETARSWVAQIPISERRKMLTIVTEELSDSKSFREWRFDLLKEMKDEGGFEEDSVLDNILHGMESFEKVEAILYDK